MLASSDAGLPNALGNPRTADRLVRDRPVRGGRRTIPIRNSRTKIASTGRLTSRSSPAFLTFKIPPIRNPIDNFIRARLTREGIKPSPEADRLTLIRRVTLDLTGLPPTPAEVDAFLKDNSPDAYEKVVDRLLASPHFGERWAQHWLDVVRFAESNGFELDADRPHAWRYRDYVVRSFNADKPYDQFVTEQIAGDELASGRTPPPRRSCGSRPGFTAAGPFTW